MCFTAVALSEQQWMGDFKFRLDLNFKLPRLSARQIHQLALEYIRWRCQVDGANVRYYTSTEHVKFFLRYLTRGGYCSP